MKSLSSYLRLTITLVLLLTLSTCKQDDPDCETCGYEQGFEMVKDWMYFKTGSYWIYEEENSGAIDTITVWEDDEGLSSGGFDSFLTYTESSYDGYFYRYRYNQSFSIHCLNTPVCDCEKVERSKSRPGDFVGSDRNFFFPPIIGNQSAAGSEWSTVIDIVENYEVIPGEFKTIAVYRIDDDLSEAHSETFFSVSKHVGIVRKEIIANNEVWNLIEYDVIQ